MEEKGRKSALATFLLHSRGGRTESGRKCGAPCGVLLTCPVLSTSGHSRLTSNCLYLYFVACWHFAAFQGIYTPGAAFKQRSMGDGVQIRQRPCPWGKKSQVCVPHHFSELPGIRLVFPRVVLCLITRPISAAFPHSTGIFLHLPKKFQLFKSLSQNLLPRTLKLKSFPDKCRVVSAYPWFVPQSLCCRPQYHLMRGGSWVPLRASEMGNQAWWELPWGDHCGLEYSLKAMCCSSMTTSS